MAQGPASRWGGRLAVALALLHAALWIALPSRDLNPDGLDELTIVEADRVAATAKHPAAEPAVWGVMRALRAVGYRGNAVRPVQLWSGAWMTVALLGVYAFARRAGRSPWPAAAASALLGAVLPSLHLAIDPYLFYWPPGLALMTWGLVAVGWRAGAAAGLLAGAALFHPMVAVAAPVAGALVLRDGGAGRRRRAALVAGVPIVAVLVARALLTDGARGPYGRWFAHSLGYAWRALSDCLATWPRAPLGALRGQHDLPSLAIAAETLLLPATAAAILAVMTTQRRRSWPWATAAAVAAAFVVWWDPGQSQFYLLPLWLLLLGTVDALSDSAPRLARAATALLGAQAALALLANLGAYVLPSATRPSAAQIEAQAIARRFGKSDLIVCPLFQDLRIDYFGHVATTGMIALHAERSPSETTFAVLKKRLAAVRARGGRLYLETLPGGAPAIPDFAREQARVDYSDGDYDRLTLGAPFVIEHRTFRELRDVDRF